MKVLLRLPVSLLQLQTPLLVALDETTEPRKGAEIKGKCVFRDAAHTSRSKFVHCNGLRSVESLSKPMNHILDSFSETV